MLPGPVFQVELVTTARRAWFYVLRALYALLLLAILGQNYLSWSAQLGVGLGGGQVYRFAQSAFYSFAVVQGLAVLAMTPALVGGTIASEAQRRTLHYLLASRLTSAEIVLGKLAARLLYIAVFLAVAMPVLSLLSLLGGVDPLLVVLAFVGTASTAWFLAGAAILVSATSRRVRDAISLLYALEAVWLIVPWLIVNLMPWASPKTYVWVAPVNEWVLATSPFQFLQPRRLIFGGVAGFATSFGWMVGLQLGLGTLLVALAVWQVRPTFRRREGRASSNLSQALKHWRWRLRQRPPVGDAPMMWKELHTSRTTGPAKLVGLLLALGLAGTLAYTTYDFARPAFRELWNSSYGIEGSAREELLAFLKLTDTCLIVLVVLGVTTAAATSITAEREEDTWTSLLSTPLGGREILRAKLLGPPWRFRWVFAGIAVLEVVGALAGSIHPLSVPLVLAEALLYTWFATALGNYLSLRSRSTWRAQSLAIGALAFLNGGYLVCCCPVFFEGWPWVGSAITPMIALGSHLNYNEWRLHWDALMHPLQWTIDRQITARSSVQVWLMNVVFYAVASLGLTIDLYLRFDRAADRPHLPPGGPASERSKPPGPADLA